MKQTSGVGESERALWMGWEQSHRHLKKVYLSPVPSIHSANLLLPWIFKPSCQQQREQLQWQSWQVPSWCPRLPTLASGSVWVWGGGDAACIADNRQRAIQQPSPTLPKQQEVRNTLALESPGLSSLANMGMPDAPDVWGHLKPWREEVSLG